MKMKDWLLKKLKVDADEVVVDLEAAAEVEIEVNVEHQGVICVITVIKMAIMQKIVQNLQRKEKHDFKMVDALFVTRKDIRKLTVLTDVKVVEIASTKEEAEAHHLEEAEVQEADPEANLILEETDLEDKSKSFFIISHYILFSRDRPEGGGGYRSRERVGRGRYNKHESKSRSLSPRDRKFKSKGRSYEK